MSRDHKTVLELARTTLNEGQDLSPLESQIQRRQIVKKLMALRAKAGLSQQDVARKLNWTSSKVSRLEAGCDDDLRLGDLRDYLGALSLDLTSVSQ